MKKVKFIGIPKYDASFISSIMEKHHTEDPEKALIEEHIPFRYLSNTERKDMSALKLICSYYFSHDFFKCIYLDGDVFVVFVKDRRSICVVQ